MPIQEFDSPLGYVGNNVLALYQARSYWFEPFKGDIDLVHSRVCGRRLDIPGASDTVGDTYIVVNVERATANTASGGQVR